MLSARKLHLLAGLKVDGLDLRSRELDFYLTRYIAIAGVSSIMTYLAYVGIIKIKIPEQESPGSELHPKGSWEVLSFYVCCVLTIAFSMFNLFLTSFMVVNAQGLSLRGPPGSVAKCVEICLANWLLVRMTLLGSLVSIFLAAMSIVWMKHDWQICSEQSPGENSMGSEEGESQGEVLFKCEISPNIISAIIASSVFVGLFCYMLHQMRQITKYLDIPERHLVVGDLTISTDEQNRLDIVAEASAAIPAAR